MAVNSVNFKGNEPITLVQVKNEWEKPVLINPDKITKVINAGDSMRLIGQEKESLGHINGEENLNKLAKVIDLTA